MYWPNHYFDIRNQFISKGNLQDSLIALAAFLAVLVAMFGERFWAYWRRPKINAYFDNRLERCFRWASVSQDSLMDQGFFLNVTRYYFRLRVSNEGLTSVRNLKAKVELYDAKKNELADRFEPTALRWITESQSIELAPKEEEYLNLISQVSEPLGDVEYFFLNNNGLLEKKGRAKIKYKLRLEVADKTPRGITWDRYLQAWRLRVTFHAENLPKPVIKYFKFTPSLDESIGKIEEDSCWENNPYIRNN